MINPVDLIIAKREGKSLTPEEITYLVDAYTRGNIPDYQMAAFLMAAFLQGMNEEETLALTRAMLHSGVVLDLSDIPGKKVDKHSTGGVGDKISLILAPLVAACGVKVPMISGRGLGHTGGTLDKLEAIPGFRTQLTIDEMKEQLRRIGVVMIGQTDEIAPADRKLYALRDVTGTVEFIPFIAASIMSKKLAEGIDGLVLDVKVGRGAFMKTEVDARKLAQTMVGIAESFGKSAIAWLTDMNVPLGYGVGNWPETAEAIACLKGKHVSDVMLLTYTLAGEMLFLGEVAETPEEGVEMAQKALASGAAYEKFLELVRAQGGDISVVEHPETRSGSEPAGEVHAPAGIDGYVADLDALEIGKTAVLMGAGRLRKEDPVDPTAGITLVKKPGDAVVAGDVLAYLHTKKLEQMDTFRERVQKAYTFSSTRPQTRPLLLKRYAKGQWITPTENP